MKYRRKKRHLRYQRLVVVIAVMALILASIVSLVDTMRHKQSAAASPSASAVSSAQASETADSSASAASTSNPTAVFTPASTDPENDTRLTDPSSILFCANKKHPLPSGYAPEDVRYVNVAQIYNNAVMREEAATAMENMFAAAQADGITLTLGSGYRSYDLQTTLYNKYVDDDGTDYADSISSRPGYSDHQTGLAADLNGDDESTYCDKSFINTDAGQWLYHNAYRYGFIMRYPEGKTDYTGYDYEPWHYRYVGVDTATAMYNIDPDLSFEEYFGISGGDYNS
ncbi:M15 family metallopeptidase [Stecheria sp. CLA-KB-P133]|uniref:M15 family metallopeptidase n=1 Tax=Grylomicrobium aquisgranensis TaxID=2926318 RepID=A0AB35U6T5_9FIRM|nr:M15 family metallopeptidase [Stecheria sp. CLA-KB-P133]